MAGGAIAAKQSSKRARTSSSPAGGAAIKAEPGAAPGSGGFRASGGGTPGSEAGGEDGGEADPELLLWRVNPEEFNRRFRHQVCVELVLDRLGRCVCRVCVGWVGAPGGGRGLLVAGVWRDGNPGLCVGEVGLWKAVEVQCAALVGRQEGALGKAEEVNRRSRHQVCDEIVLDRLGISY